MPALKVHLLDSPDPAAMPALRENLAEEVRLTNGPELPSPPDYHVLVAGRPDREQLQASPNLHTLVIPFAGVPDSTRQLLAEFPHIAVHNLHHNAAMTAEMAVALLLAAAKFIIPFDQALRRNDWSARYEHNPSLTLDGMTALVLGFGQIGQRIAKACWALDMEVLAVRRNPQPTGSLDFKVEVQGLEALDELLERTHALLIALPATPETKDLIGANELSRMQAGGVLVNVGRGAIVDQAALYTALKDGRLAAAGLDVWYNYPQDSAGRANTPPAGYPFHELENVVMSPHRAGASRESEAIRMAHLAALFNAAARGGPIPNQVDLQAGY